MKLTDHESDTLASARLGTPPTATIHLPVYRESWLDKIARHLGSTPVDLMPIVPRTRASDACCSTAQRG